MLFDTKADPEEKTDVSHLHPERAAANRERVLEWRDGIGIGIGRKRLRWAPSWLTRQKACKPRASK